MPPPKIPRKPTMGRPRTTARGNRAISASMSVSVVSLGNIFHFYDSRCCCSRSKGAMGIGGVLWLFRPEGSKLDRFRV